jgi:hypothetical protein
MPTKKGGSDGPDVPELAAGILVGGVFLAGYGIYKGIKYLTTDHEKRNADKLKAEEADRWRAELLRARQEREERIARLKEIAAGRDFCERCGTIEPERCDRCGRCIRCTGRCYCGNCLYCYGDSGGECNSCSSD